MRFETERLILREITQEDFDNSSRNMTTRTTAPPECMPSPGRNGKKTGAGTRRFNLLDEV